MKLYDPAEAAGLVPQDSALFTTGIPERIGDVFEALPELGVMQRRGGPFVRLGTVSPVLQLCLDPSTGEVIMVLLYSDAPPKPANASLEAFVECARAWEEGADAQALHAIDPTTVDRTGFWKAEVGV
jgi:hypothetical protein